METTLQTKYKIEAKLAAWSRWGLKMSMLREIHGEVEPHRENTKNYGRFYRMRNVDLEGAKL